MKPVKRSSIKAVKKGNIMPDKRDGIRSTQRGSIRSAKKGDIKPVQRVSIKSIQKDSIKTTQGGGTKTASSGSSKSAGNGKYVNKLASLSSETGSSRTVTTKLSDRDVLLAQMPPQAHTDMTRPFRARLKENRVAMIYKAEMYKTCSKRRLQSLTNRLKEEAPKLNKQAQGGGSKA